MDIPGHMGQILKNHPEFQLPSSSGIKFPATLNIMDEKAVQFALSIVDEYMNLFPDSKYIGLGFDEIFAIIGDKVLDFSNMDVEAKKRFGPNADRNDLVVDLANRFTKHVLSKGKIPYVWNEGVSESKVVKLDKRAVVRYWTHSDKALLKPNYWFNNGYQVVNFNENALYYVPSIAKLPLEVQNTLQPVATLQTVHNWYPLWFPAMDYSVRTFIPQKITPKEAGNKLLGSVLSLWGNFPDLFTPDEAFNTLKYLLAEFAIKNWNPTYKHDLKLTQKLVKNFS